MGYEEINKKKNDRIQEISQKLKSGITERERNELTEIIYPKLKFFIWGFCKNELDTEEVLQWTFKKIFKNIASFDIEKGRFTTWAYKIARNESLYYIFQKNKVSFVDIDEMFSLQNVADDYNEVLDKELTIKSAYEITVEVISNMEDALMKNIAIDKMLNNRKVKQIAIDYDINENTVKTKLRKIRTDISESVYMVNPKLHKKILEVI